jgi:hypothetical protein
VFVSANATNVVVMLRQRGPPGGLLVKGLTLLAVMMFLCGTRDSAVTVMRCWFQGEHVQFGTGQGQSGRLCMILQVTMRVPSGSRCRLVEAKLGSTYTAAAASVKCSCSICL